MAKKLSTDPYKGVRDFFPKDMAVENRIFDIWKGVAKKYGYEEYAASVLEPAELYKAKTGEEIVNEQTYTFTDRGNREVTLRPEMTPTLARMIAAKRRDLIFPVRWFSIPNLFRYEQPQRGRLREHWQLNVDIFGITGIEAEIEIINMAYDITLAYGLKPENFEIRLNDRRLMNKFFFEILKLDENQSQKISKLIDKKNKIDQKTFDKSALEVLSNNKELLSTLKDFLTDEDSDDTGANVNSSLLITPEIKELMRDLKEMGVSNARFDPTLMRGFDYYTGIVFEVFDTNPNNRRSVFGGGRYDELLTLFGNEKIPAVGFGAGDVIARDLMETYGRLDIAESTADISICVMGDNNLYASKVAQILRRGELRVSVDYSGKKIGDQIAKADKKGIKRVLVIGDMEAREKTVVYKDLETKEENTLSLDNIVSIAKVIKSE